MAFQTENERQAELVHQMYGVAMTFLEDIISKKFGIDKKSRIVILGGIQINMPLPLTDYFQPLMFESRSYDNSVEGAGAVKVIDFMRAFDDE